MVIKIENDILGHNDTRFWITKSPIFVCNENAREAYVQDSIVIVVKLFPILNTLQ